jgi:hypothetical protein
MKLLLGALILLPIMVDRVEAQQRVPVADHDPFAEAKLTKEYREAYKQGAAEAEQEIKKGVVTLYTFGLRTLFENLDKDTGLPIQAIAGCVIDDGIIGRRAGHDDAVTAHIKLHGLPPNSFKRWEKDIFELKEFFDRESKTTPPTRLKDGGPTLKSPDGKFTIRPALIDLKGTDDKPFQRLGFVLGGETLNPTSQSILFDDGETDLLWGPKGSRFAVFRCKSSKTDLVQYMAFDLQRGTSLRWESSTRR